jgi:hypothetical protein
VLLLLLLCVVGSKTGTPCCSSILGSSMLYKGAIRAEPDRKPVTVWCWWKVYSVDVDGVAASLQLIGLLMCLAFIDCCC